LLPTLDGPYGHRCGEFRPTGKAPGSASVANSLPKPLMYPGSGRAVAGDRLAKADSGIEAIVIS
jgi:hypothetical protein